MLDRSRCDSTVALEVKLQWLASCGTTRPEFDVRLVVPASHSLVKVTVVLLEQVTPATANAVIVGNDHGSVEVNRSNWGTTVANTNSAPTPPRDMQPQTMNRILRNIDTTRRIGVPAEPVDVLRYLGQTLTMV